MYVKTHDSGSLFFPDGLVKSIKSIDLDYWKNQGIKAICFDLDSTLLEHGGAYLQDESLKSLEMIDLPILIATNRRLSQDIIDITAQIEASACITPTKWSKRKPIPGYYKRVIEESGFEASELLMVGDRVIQDVWGANIAGMQTVMVEKLGKLPWHEKLLSTFDRWVVKRIHNNYELIKRH